MHGLVTVSMHARAGSSEVYSGSRRRIVEARESCRTTKHVPPPGPPPGYRVPARGSGSGGVHKLAFSHTCIPFVSAIFPETASTTANMLQILDRLDSHHILRVFVS
jgi:hypothetical protein